MKKMKKLLALVMALAMALSIAVTTSYAATGDTLSVGTQELAVAAGLNPGSWTYTAPAEGELTVTVLAATYNEPNPETGADEPTEVPEDYLGNVLARSGFTVKGEGVYSTSTTVSVNAGDEVEVTLAAINMCATTYSVKLSFDATSIYDGDNTIMIAAADLTNQYSYTATQTGTLYFTVTAFNYTSQWGTSDMSDYLEGYFDPEVDNWFELNVNGVALSNLYYGSVDVTAGDVVDVEWKIISNNTYVQSYEMGAVLNLNYEGYDIPTPGSAEAPIELNVSECPVNSVEIAAGESAYYELMNFDGRNFTVTGENVSVKVGYESLAGTTYEVFEAVDGVVTVPGHSWMFPVEIINNGDEAAVYELNCEALTLVEGSTVLDTSVYGGGAYYIWTAECDGKLNIEVDTENTGDIWVINVFTDSYSVYQGISSFVEDGPTEVTVDVTKGMKLNVQIMDPYTSGVVAVNTSWEYPHTWDEGTVTDTPDCINGGEMTYVCTICGEDKAEPVEALGHTPAEAVKEDEHGATCTEGGYYNSVVYCDECGEELSSVKVDTDPATGHDLTKVDAVAPTAEKDGNIEYYVCGECEKLFKDAEGKNEITLADTVVKYEAPKTETPKTGDEAPIVLMATMAALAAAAFVLLNKKRA